MSRTLARSPPILQLKYAQLQPPQQNNPLPPTVVPHQPQAFTALLQLQLQLHTAARELGTSIRCTRPYLINLLFRTLGCRSPLCIVHKCISRFISPIPAPGVRQTIIRYHSLALIRNHGFAILSSNSHKKRNRRRLLWSESLVTHFFRNLLSFLVFFCAQHHPLWLAYCFPTYSSSLSFFMNNVGS